MLKSLKSIKQNIKQFQYKQLLFQSNNYYPPHIKIFLPTLLPGMYQGKIDKWTVDIGDKIVLGDVICDVDTSLAIIGYQIEDIDNEKQEMYFAKHLVDEGELIEVGSIIGIAVDNLADVQYFNDFKQIH